MKLLNIYNGTIRAMHGTPCKVAVFTDGKDIKVFSKPFFKNSYGTGKWERNVIIEGYKNIKIINEKLIASGHKIQ